VAAEPVFSDRFSRENPILTPSNVDSLKEEDLLNASSQLKLMVNSVRRTDATLSRKSAKEIFYVITGYADPRIGGILAAARDKATGKRVFESIEEVKQIMYPQSGSEDLDLTVFNDMVRQACVTLTASKLVGNLSPGGDNFRNHEEYLASAAISDIERITETIDMDQIRQRQQENEESTKSAFYFQKAHFDLDEPLNVSVFMSGATGGWQLVDTFQGPTTTADIVSKIADFINSLTMSSVTVGSPNILAASILAGDQDTPVIEFSTRRYSNQFSSEIISIKFDRSSVPFNWGVKLNDLSPYQINSQILETQSGTTDNNDNLNPLLEDREGTPTVLYIRRKEDITPLKDDKYSFRVSPSQNEENIVSFPRYTSNDQDEQDSLDNQRPSQLGLSLVQEMHDQRTDTKCLGAIIKSDPPDDVPNPTVAVELIGYKVMVKDVWLVLDLIVIPRDIEVAVGDLREPLTSFSNEPRSIRVETSYLDSGNVEPRDVKDEPLYSSPKLVNRPNSSLLNQVRNRLDEWNDMDRYYPRHRHFNI